MRLLMRTFSEHCSSGLFILNFYILEYVVDDIRASESFFVLDASSFEQYNTNMNQVYKQM